MVSRDTKEATRKKEALMVLAEPTVVKRKTEVLR